MVTSYLDLVLNEWWRLCCGVWPVEGCSSLYIESRGWKLGFLLWTLSFVLSGKQYIISQAVQYIGCRQWVPSELLWVSCISRYVQCWKWLAGQCVVLFYTVKSKFTYFFFCYLFDGFIVESKANGLGSAAVMFGQSKWMYYNVCTARTTNFALPVVWCFHCLNHKSAHITPCVHCKLYFIVTAPENPGELPLFQGLYWPYYKVCLAVPRLKAGFFCYILINFI